MSIDKQHIRHCLLFTYHLNKNAAEAKKLICKAWGENAVSYSTCKKWYHRFKNGNFDLNDESRPGQPRKVEDAEIEELLKKDPYRTPSQLADELGVSRQAISKRLNKLGMIRKRAIEMPEEASVSSKSSIFDSNESSKENKS